MVHTQQGSSSDAAKLKRQVASQAADVKSQAKQGVDEIKDQAADAADTAKAKLVEAKDRAKESGRQYASAKKGQAADEIGVFSGAIRKAADKLREEKHDSIASYVEAAAEQLDDFRGSLQSKSVREIIDDVQEATRKHPELVYGGLFVAGLAAMRFFKASNSRQTPSVNSRDQSRGQSSRAVRQTGQQHPLTGPASTTRSRVNRGEVVGGPPTDRAVPPAGYRDPNSNIS